MSERQGEHHAERAAGDAIGTTGPDVRPDLAAPDHPGPAGDEHLTPDADNAEGAQRSRRREPDATGARPADDPAPGRDTGQEAAPVSEPG